GCGITFVGSDPTTATCTNPTYEWYQSTDNASDNGTYTIIPGATGQNYTPTSGQKNNWFKRVTTCGPCSAAQESNHIHWQVSIAATISGTTSVCAGAASPNITFTTSSGTPPITYTYSINGGPDQTVTTSAFSNTVAVPVPTGTPGTYTYSLTGVTDAIGCSDTITGQTATVTVNPIPVVTPTFTSPICSGSSSGITLSSSISPTTFAWTVVQSGVSG